MKSFSEYLNRLCEEDEEKKLQDLNDDCDDGDCDDGDCDDEGDEDDDEITESAQLQLELLQQIQPKLAKAPLNVLKQVLKRLSANDDE